MTPHPTQAWVAQQARNFVMAETIEKPAFLLRDFDGKFSKAFDGVLTAEGVQVVKVGPRKPNLNAFAERWVQSIKEECLDHFLVFGEAHLRHLVEEYVAHYNLERPHQGLGNRPLTEAAEPMEPSQPLRLSDIVVEHRLGGLLKHYRRRAAA